jgi:recombination protein RecA
LASCKKSGSWFSYESDKLGQGRDAVKQLLTDNPELADEIEKKIKDKVMLALHPLPVEKEEE